MKVLVGLALAVALVFPSSAAAGELACDLGDIDRTEEDARVGHILGPRDAGGLGGAEDIQAMLGEQAAGFWSGTREPLAMGVAPGPLSFEEARAAISDLLTDRFGAADAALVMSRLGLYPMPYGDAELRRIVDEIDGLIADEYKLADELWWVVEVGCLDGEAWRVEVGLFSEATPEDIAKIREIIAPFGDRVRLYLDGLVALPGAGGGTVASRLRASFIKLRSPKRCVRAKMIQLKTRKSARAVIRSLTVKVDGRRRALRENRLTIRVRRGVTRVRVVIRVGDGSRLAHTFKFRRC